MIRGLGFAAALAIADPAAAQAPSGAIREAVLAEMSRLGIPGLSLAVAEGSSLVHLVGCAGAGAARTAYLTLLREAMFRPAGMMSQT